MLTSFIAIPAATLILYLCASLFILVPLASIGYVGGIIQMLTAAIASILVSITQFINTVFRLTTLLPGASIDGVQFGKVQLCLLYLVVFTGYLFWSSYVRNISRKIAL